MRKLLIISLLALVGCDNVRDEHATGPRTYEQAAADAWSATVWDSCLQASSITPTGSMEPILGHRHVVLIDTCYPFDQLTEGQIVSYHPEGAKYPILHRTYRREAGGWLMVGQANSRPDKNLCTAENFRGVLYATFNHK